MTINRFARRADCNQQECSVCKTQFTPKWRSRDQRYQRACSIKCAASLRDFSGEKNPNWSAAGWHECKQCGQSFHNYSSKSLYCSLACRDEAVRRSPEARARMAAIGRSWKGVTRPKKPRKLRDCVCKECGVAFTFKTKRKYCEAHQHIARAIGLKKCQEAPRTNSLIECNCVHCGAAFKRWPSAFRRYCSYACHIKSGGAIRAGLSAVRMTSVYGAKKDANHKEIVAVVKKCGIPFIDLSTLGCGIPDLLVEVAGQLQLWEIKNRKTSYGRKGLNKNQKAWAEGWRGSPVKIIENIDDALKAMGVTNRTPSEEHKA